MKATIAFASVNKRTYVYYLCSVQLTYVFALLIGR